MYNNNNKTTRSNQLTNQLTKPGHLCKYLVLVHHKAQKTRHWVVDKRHCRARAGNLDNSKERKEERKRVGRWGGKQFAHFIYPQV
jgi:hypothetical protein